MLKQFGVEKLPKDWPLRDIFANDVSRSSTVSLIPLKKFATERLAKNSALRDVLLEEKDEITRPEFLAKMTVWLALLKRREE
jgi:hypothetical protein